MISKISINPFWIDTSRMKSWSLLTYFNDKTKSRKKWKGERDTSWKVKSTRNLILSWFIEIFFYVLINTYRKRNWLKFGQAISFLWLIGNSITRGGMMRSTRLCLVGPHMKAAIRDQRWKRTNMVSILLFHTEKERERAHVNFQKIMRTVLEWNQFIRAC